MKEAGGERRNAVEDLLAIEQLLHKYCHAAGRFSPGRGE